MPIDSQPTPGHGSQATNLEPTSPGMPRIRATFAGTDFAVTLCILARRVQQSVG